MTQNKLLRSCMWWGNQEGKWAGNSLLHATLIHPSVWKKPCHYAHLIEKKGPRIIIVGPQYTDPRSAARSAEVSPAASGLSEGFQNSSINSTGTSLLCAEHEVAPCVKSIWSGNRKFILQSKRVFFSLIFVWCIFYLSFHSCFLMSLIISSGHRWLKNIPNSRKVFFVFFNSLDVFCFCNKRQKCHICSTNCNVATSKSGDSCSCWWLAWPVRATHSSASHTFEWYSK